MTRTTADPCFFVLGYGRSGTTLFRRMLSAHPALFVAPENDVFQWLPAAVRHPVCDEAGLRDLASRFPPYYDRIYDREQFVASALADAPLRAPALIMHLQGAALIGRDKPHAQWGHKAPSEWPYVPTMSAWFPRSRFLHLVRHPHDSTASMVEYQLQRYRTTPVVAIWQWRKAFRAIRRHGREVGPDRYTLLHYEDLVTDTAATLTTACTFLGVDTKQVPRMVDFLSDASAVHVDEGRHMARAETAVTSDRVGRSTGDYSERQAAMIDHVCRHELAELGYQPRATRPATARQRRSYDLACAALDASWAALRASRRLRGQL